MDIQLKVTPEVTKKFFDAIKNGNYTLVRQMLDMGVDPNGTDDEGTLPIEVAYQSKEKGAHRIFTLLLERGAKDRTKNEKGERFFVVDASKKTSAKRYSKNKMVVSVILKNRFFEAVKEGDIATIKDVLENKSIPSVINSRDEQGCTALMYACEMGNFELVKALLAHDPNLLLKDKEGKTVLDYASRLGDKNIIQAIKNKQKEYENRVMRALLAGKEATYEEDQAFYSVVENGLVDLADMDARSKFPSFLEMARKSGREDYASFLLEQGADLLGGSGPSESEKLRLHYAVKRGNIAEVQDILNKNPDLSFTDEQGRTIIDQAVQHSNDEMLDLLLNHARVNAQTQGYQGLVSQESENLQALIDAIRKCDVDRAKEIIDRMPRVNIQDSKGDSPASITCATIAHMAFSTGKECTPENIAKLSVILYYLREKGADLTLTSQGKAPLIVLCDALKKNKEDVTQPDEISEQKKALVEHIIFDYIHNNERDDFDILDGTDRADTLLHHAIEVRSFPVILSLIQQGASLDIENANHQTARDIILSRKDESPEMKALAFSVDIQNYEAMINSRASDSMEGDVIDNTRTYLNHINPFSGSFSKKAKSVLKTATRLYEASGLAEKAMLIADEFDLLEKYNISDFERIALTVGSKSGYTPHEPTVVYDKPYQNAMAYAICNADAPMVARLVSEGVYPTVQMRSGYWNGGYPPGAKASYSYDKKYQGDNALHLLVRNGYYDEAAKLLSYFERLPLLQSPSGDYLSSLGLLLDAKNDEGQTPLMLAAKSQNKKMMDLLLFYGADTSVCDNFNNTAINYAGKDTLAREHLEQQIQRIENGEEIERPEVPDFLPSFEEQKLPTDQSFQVLKEINSENPDSFFLLMQAVENANVEFLGVLIQAGVDVNQADSEGIKPLDYVIYNLNEQASIEKKDHEYIEELKNMALLLKKAGAKESSEYPLSEEAKKLEGVAEIFETKAASRRNTQDDKEVLKKAFITLIGEKGANLRAVDPKDRTSLLIKVIETGDVDLIWSVVQSSAITAEALLEKGIDGQNAIEIAYQTENPEIIEAMEETMTRTGIVLEDYKKTCLVLAATREATFGLLEEALNRGGQKLDLRVQDQDGKTILHHLAEKGQTDLILQALLAQRDPADMRGLTLTDKNGKTPLDLLPDGDAKTKFVTKVLLKESEKQEVNATLVTTLLEQLDKELLEELKKNVVVQGNETVLKLIDDKLTSTAPEVTDERTVAHETPVTTNTSARLVENSEQNITTIQENDGVALSYTSLRGRA